MTQNEIEELKELIGNNCEWNNICAVGPLLDLLQDEKNGRERLMEQNKSLARQYVSMRQRAEQAEAGEKLALRDMQYWQKIAEQAEAQCKRMEDALQEIAKLHDKEHYTLFGELIACRIAKAALEGKP